MTDTPFKLFINLIEFDQETRKLHAQIDDAIAAYAAQEHEKKMIMQEVEKAGAIYKDLRKQIDEHELEIKSLNEQEKKKQVHLESSSGDYKRYQAVKREIDQLKLDQMNTEEKLMALWNKAEIAEKEFNVLKEKTAGQLQVIEKKLIEEQANIELKKTELEGRTQKRAPLLIGVPEEWLENYEQMSMQIADPVVPVTDDSCSGCSYAINTAELNRLRRRAIVQCKGCFRLLFMKEVMDDNQNS